MQAHLNLAQKFPVRNGHGPTEAFTEAFISQTDNRTTQLSTERGLVIAARACHSVLFGEPHPASFDRDDLSQTLEILTQIATSPVFHQQSE
ncbi:MAG: hypothetical protein BroJett011_33690 [Chloroflexota bacterium]|nr:MAG: hypothetical protein BroJett011_33690 [Chloroflexota bacterium]